jgi:protein tyrosine phosphatase (PTP) superfamily phosphohydrolase (DUF442 family)
MSLEQLALPNLKVPRDGVYSCGQPTPEQLRALKDAGVRTVVDLRGPGEIDWDERSMVETLGMAYHRIAVSGPGDINEAHARRLGEIVDDEASRPLVMHCGSGNRVGALYALKAYHCDGIQSEEAVQVGRDAGLAQLEPFVRQCMASG